MSSPTSARRRKLERALWVFGPVLMPVPPGPVAGPSVLEEAARRLAAAVVRKHRARRKKGHGGR